MQLYFQHHYSSLQCHMIFRNHFNMLIYCSRNISDYYQCWKQLWKLWCILFFFDVFPFICLFLFVYFSLILWWTESSKEQHLFEVEIFCNIIHVFTVTFDQFNASLLNRNMNVFQKNLTDCKRQYYIIFTLCMCENKSHILTLKEVSELLELQLFIFLFFLFDNIWYYC